VVAARPAVLNTRTAVGKTLDSKVIAPGANDNASGSATVLELARDMAAQERADLIGMIAIGMAACGKSFVARTMGKGPQRMSVMLRAYAPAYHTVNDTSAHCRWDRLAQTGYLRRIVD